VQQTSDVWFEGDPQPICVDRALRGGKMKSTTFRILAGMLASLILGASSGVHGESEVQPVPQAAAPLTAEQLDQMLAPIALYPDPLVAQILMAATYPLEVVEADRWVQQPGNAALQGGQLTDALEQQPWDPSVKSLAPFPQVLKMLDDNLEWTERIGDAFLASQPAVMDSIQRLRQRAQAAGTLQSIPEEAVNQVGQDITIQPASADTVYVPVYNPTVAYGAWPYPAYPPYYFPDNFYDAVPGPFGFGWVSVAIVVPLWGWQHCDWHRHHIDLDRDRFADLDHHHRPSGVEWTHDPWHRHGAPYRDPVVQSRFASNAASPDARPAARGNPAALAVPSSRTVPAVAGMPGGAHPQAAPVPAPQGPHAQMHQVWAPRAQELLSPQVPHVQAPQVLRAPPAQMPRPAAVVMPHVAPGFVPSGRGPGMQTPAMPGRVSVMPAPVFRPAGGVARPATSDGTRTH
jgi:hypothetical protein